jgi:hypothetical protein
MKFFVYMKNGMQDRNLKISLVDIDDVVLVNSLSAVTPLMSEHIRRRGRKLSVDVWRGNVAKPNPNFTDVDCVVALELIEHVYPDVIEEIPFHIFGTVAPKIAIISTPNCEFNQLFVFEEGRKFRHDDHKFEWDRQQFRDWSQNICERFPNYTVQIEGIGPPPNEEQLEPIGCCSQLALFMRKDFLESLNQMKDDAEEEKCTTQEYNEDNHYSDLNPCSDYELLKSINYPVFVDSRDRKQKIIDECSYHINRFKYMDENYYNSDNYRTEIPIQDVASACWEVCDDKCEILEAIKEKYKIENDVIIFENLYDEDCQEETQ